MIGGRLVTDTVEDPLIRSRQRRPGEGSLLAPAEELVGMDLIPGMAEIKRGCPRLNLHVIVLDISTGTWGPCTTYGTSHPVRYVVY